MSEGLIGERIERLYGADLAPDGGVLHVASSTIKSVNYSTKQRGGGGKGGKGGRGRGGGGGRGRGRKR